MEMVAGMAIELVMRWSDWQTWVVTVIALGAAWVVLRMLVPASWLGGSRKKGTRARLTVGGKPVEKT